jgi:hypothetical protein
MEADLVVAAFVVSGLIALPVGLAADTLLDTALAGVTLDEAPVAFADALAVPLAAADLESFAAFLPPNAASHPSAYAALGPTRKIVISIRSLKKGFSHSGTSIVDVTSETAAKLWQPLPQTSSTTHRSEYRLGRVNALVTSFRAFLNILAVSFATTSFVDFEVAFAPVQLSVALKRQNMCR